MEVMSAVQLSLQTLLADIKKTNENATSQLTGTLEEAMKKAAENQQILTDQMREFVQEFKNIVDEERKKSKGAIDDAMAKVLSDLSSAIAQMEKVRTDAAEGEKKRNDHLHDGTKVLIGDLSGQIEKLLSAVSEQVVKTQQNIDAIGAVSTRAVDGMNQGALTMGAAANRFETAGNSVSAAIDKAGLLSETLNSTASSLQAAALAVKQGFDQYDSTRKTVDSQVASLMGLIESAKKEAGISKELVQNITASANSLKNAEAASREHLEQVNAALVKAF
jgi:molecular chaperone GrpE (heat shock protein)